MKKTNRRRAASPRPPASREYFTRKTAARENAAKTGLKSTWASPKPGKHRGSVAIRDFNEIIHPGGKQTPWMKGLDSVQKRVDSEQ